MSPPSAGFTTPPAARRAPGVALVPASLGMPPKRQWWAADTQPHLAFPARVGAWRLEREIGQGGMSTVFLARHESTGQRAAVKVPRSEHAREPDLVRRFATEARALMLVQHPNVARAYQYVELPDGRPCIVLEFLEGRTLEERASSGPLSVAEAVPLLLQVCAGLAAAHERGVVHRDVKAQNVWLARLADGSEQVKVFDFGAALFASEAASTQPGFVLGTPHYMSPEQVQGARADARADVYAVGVLAHRLLSGAVPFDGASPVEVMAKHVLDPPPPLANIPVQLAELIRRALAKRPQDRPAHAGLLVDALCACAGALPLPRPPAPARPWTLSPARAPAAEVRHELERLRERATSDHYWFLGVETDASAPEIRAAAGRIERRLDALDQSLDGELASVAGGLRKRLAQARRDLDDPPTRAWHDALLGNFRGVARCLSSGLTTQRMDSMHRKWSEQYPERASKALSLCGAADIHLRVRDRERALDCLQRALEVAPLSPDLHRRYWALRHELAQQAPLPRAG